jgi:hypothetical protein
VGQTTLDLLSEVGTLVSNRRNECLVFKKNAGKYVGNVNYTALALAELRRAADELFLSALGISQNDREAIYDHVGRVLAINESAGEKSIPAGVKAKFPAKPHDRSSERKLLKRVEAHIAKVRIEAI